MLVKESASYQDPIPFQNFVAEHLPRIKSAHGVVTFHSTVHDSSISLLSNTLLRNLRIDPIWESPHLRVDLSKLHWGAGVICYRLLESRVEFSVVQEDVWVVVPSIEMPLDRLDRLDNTFQLLIPCQHHKRRICPWFRSIWF
jgi:hypothetical protein